MLQSLSVVAVAKQSHQVDVQHIQTEHSHQLDNLAEQSEFEEAHDVQDCHHCGHCHGAHAQWVFSKSCVIASQWLANNYYLYFFIDKKIWVEELNRPPIA